MSAAQRDSNATQEEKQQKKHKKHSKQYSEEPTEEETPKEEQPEQTTEEETPEEPKEEDPFGGEEEINLNKSLEGKGKSIEYINFSKLYFNYSFENYKGFDNKHPMRLLATISEVSEVSEKTAKLYKDNIKRYKVKYSVMKLYLNYKQDGKDNWKSLDVFDMAKTFQAKHPNDYNYSYCLSDSFTVKEDVKEIILKNNGIFTIFIRWFKSEDMETPRLIYKDTDDKIILSYPKDNPKFKQGIEYYKKLLPGFASKYTYKIYDEFTKMNIEFQAKQFEAATKNDDELLKSFE